MRLDFVPERAASSSSPLGGISNSSGAGAATSPDIHGQYGDLKHLFSVSSRAGQPQLECPDGLKVLCPSRKVSMALKTNRSPKEILQSINCFVQSSNKRLKCSTVRSLTKVATLTTLLALTDPKTAPPSSSIATRHFGSLPRAYFLFL